MKVNSKVITTTDMSGRDFVTHLKRKPEEIIERLVISIKNEPEEFTKDFVEEGGIEVMVNIAETNIEKWKKSPKQKYAQTLQNTLLASKSLMYHEDAIKRVVETPGILSMMICSLEIISERMKVTVLNLMAALSIIDSKIHEIMLNLIKENIFVILSLACSVNAEVAAAAFTFVNAVVVAKTPESPLQKELKIELIQKGLRSIAEEWQRKKSGLAESMKMQLSIFDKSTGDLSIIKEEKAENPEVIFNRILTSAKGTPVYNELENVMYNLLQIPVYGLSSINQWSMISNFIKAMSKLDPKNLNDRSIAFDTVIIKFKDIEKGLVKPNNQNELALDSLSESIAKVKEDFSMKTNDVNLNKENSVDITKTDKAESTYEESEPKEKIDQTIVTEEKPLPAPVLLDLPPGPPPPPPTRMPNSQPPPIPNIPTKPLPVTPTIKMRPLFWSKIPHKDLSKTIWSKMNDNIYVPVEILEKEFCVSDVQPKKKIDQKVKTLILLDRKRWQNLSIMLKRFSDLDLSDLREAILSLDDTLLRPDDLQAMIPFIPQKDEIEILKPYVDKIPDNLGFPETYFIAIMDIPDLSNRLNYWLLKQTFPSKFIDIKVSVETLLRALKEIRENTKLFRIFEIILAFGNFLNDGTNRGGAWGFRIDLLTKLIDIKSKSDPSFTLLHSVIQYLEEAYPEVLDFNQQMRSLEKSTTLQIEATQESIKFLKESFSSVEDFMVSPGSELGSFREAMKKFLPTAKDLLNKLSGLLTKGKTLVDELCILIGENPKTFPIDTLFSTIDSFTKTFMKTRIDLEKIKLEMKEKEKKKVAMLKRKNKGEVRKSRLLDTVLDDLASGRFTHRQY